MNATFLLIYASSETMNQYQNHSLVNDILVMTLIQSQSNINRNLIEFDESHYRICSIPFAFFPYECNFEAIVIVVFFFTFPVAYQTIHLLFIAIQEPLFIS